MHLLRDVNPKRHPLEAFPAGITGVTKAAYLFADDPTPGADPNIRILANVDKFNFGPTPASLEFEYATHPVSVRSAGSGRMKLQDHGVWISRGESTVPARKLLVTLSPIGKERLREIVTWELFQQLREGPVAKQKVQAYFLTLQPPVSWRTVQRIAEDWEIVITPDPKDGRKSIWALPPELAEGIEGATGLEDIEFTEVDIPDEIPEEWTTGDGDAGDEATDEEDADADAYDDAHDDAYDEEASEGARLPRALHRLEGARCR